MADGDTTQSWTNPHTQPVPAGDPTAVVDTFTCMDYQNTFVYLYGDLVNFCVSHNGQSYYGRSSDGSHLYDASAAWTNWQAQMPDDISQLIQHGYKAAQDLGSASRTVAENARTVEQAAKVVADIASVVGVICLITGVASAVAGTMAGIDAAAIKTEQVAHQIYDKAVQLNWAAFDMLAPLHEMEVSHSVVATVQQNLGTVQQDLEWLLNEVQQILHAVL